MKKRTLSAVKIEDKQVREYLARVYPGSQIYVPRVERQKTKRDFVKILVKAGCSTDEICRCMRICPAVLTALKAQAGIAGETPEVHQKRRYVKRNAQFWAGQPEVRQKRRYVKRNAQFWANHPGKDLAAS